VKLDERQIKPDNFVMMARLNIYLLGTLQAELDGKPVFFEYTKVQALLAYLIVEVERPVKREKLAALLWPESSQQAAHSGLRQALSRLRVYLDDRKADSPFIIAQHDTLQFNQDSNAWCDVHFFDRVLAECDAHSHDLDQPCETCAGWQTQLYQVYRGDFLEWLTVPKSTAFEEWAQIHRERKRRQALETMGILAEYHHRRGDYHRMLEIALRQVEIDPFYESAHCQVMRALALSGQRSQAVSHFNDFRSLLLNEMGLQPAPETLDLLEVIKAGASG
jgi:DNA-binding SARP family transcriptional activator